MIKSQKYDQAHIVNRNSWYLVLRLSAILLLSGSALALLKPTTFTHALVAIYVILGLFYFTYNLSTKSYAGEFVRIIIIIQLSIELVMEGLLVNHGGGGFSPFVLFFILSIIISAIYFHLFGSITVATIAGLLFSLPVFFDISAIYERLIEPPRLAYSGMISDEAFYTVFLHLCLFYFFAFISGYLAQKLSATSLELRRLRLETGEILEQMRSGLLTVDKNGTIVYFNHAAGAILGADPKSSRGKSLRELFGNNQAEFCRRIEAALESERAEDRSEISIVSGDSKSIPIGLSLSVIKDDSMQLSGIIAVFQDLTEVKKLEERMRMTDRLAAVGQLAAGIAHEIRNPLASISGSVEVLKDELNPQGENLRLMELMLKETARLNTILSDFLNFARVGKGSSGKCDLGVVIPEVIELARGNSEINDSMDISHELHRPQIMIAGGEDQIRQVLWNLILNSAQALNRTGGQIRVHTEDYMDDKSGNMIKLVVEDDGPGISPGIRNKIFDPFFSTKQGGTGLGLSMVVRIVDYLGGRTELDSSEGTGTRFSIFLPVEKTEIKSVALQEVI